MVLLSFRDAYLYQEDVNLLSDGNWLNEACINFIWRLLEAEYENAGYSASAISKIALMDPTVVSYLRFQIEPEEYADYVSGSGVLDKEWLLFPINNAKSLMDSGTHWSLLAYSTKNHTAVHLDSMSGSNAQPAQAFLQAFSKIVSSNTTTAADTAAGARMIHVRKDLCPQQLDDYNCGIYMILAADVLAKQALQDSDEDDARAAVQDTTTFSTVERQHFRLQYYVDGGKDSAWLERLRQSANPATAAAFRESIRAEVAAMLAAQASTAKK